MSGFEGHGQNHAQDYGSVSGFGSHTAAQVEELQKALSISQSYGTTAPGNLSGGSALSVEDLDRTLKLVTNGLEHLKLWKDISKEKVAQVVHQYNVQNSYGEEVSPFFAIGGNPVTTTANYDREFVQIKYLGTQAQVQHDLTLIQAAHGPVVAREVKNKTVELLSRNERAMFDADENINALEYSGIYAQVRDKQGQAQFRSSAFAGFDVVGEGENSILDIRGRFDEDVAEEMALRNINGFGMAMDCYLGTDTHSVFSRDYFERQRTIPGSTLTSGNRVKNHTGSIDFRYKPSLFNRPRRVPLLNGVSPGAVPTIANATTAINADSKFLAADAGDYSYVVSLVYEDGETVASAQQTVTVAAGEAVSLEISFAVGTPLYANIFRAQVGTTSGHQYIGRIALGASGASVLIDSNAQLPGSARAFLLSHDSDVFCWKQLGSLIKYDLAVTNTSYRWLQLLYGTPLVMAPRKLTIADNLI